MPEAKVVGRIGSTVVFSFLAVVIANVITLPAHAQTAFVLGGGFAQDCYQAVKNGAPTRSTRALCDRALQSEALSTNDLAATLVNRGILSVRDRQGAQALNDFNAALQQNPALAPAFLNRAGAYLLLGRWLDAKVDADTALGIGLQRDTWAAHFNRAVALERLGDVSAAYAAFQRAAELAPNQDLVRAELARFRVTTAPVG
jgi:tetratricopeptide (TPR) repeat protein